MRITCPYLATYLHASCNVIDNNAGGGIPGQNAGADAAPDGLTIGSINALSDIELFLNGTPGLTFNLRAEPLLPSFPNLSTDEIATPGSGLTSFKQLVDSRVPVTSLEIANSSVGLLARLLYGAHKIPVKFISGYSGSAALAQGFVRGDGQSTFFSFAPIQSLIEARQAVPLIQTSPAIKGEGGYSIMRKVPTIEQFAATNPPKTKDGKAELAAIETIDKLGTIWFVPQDTPAKLYEALSAAAQFALTRSGLQKQAINDGLIPGVLSPKAMKSALDAAINSQSQLKTWLSVYK